MEFDFNVNKILANFAAGTVGDQVYILKGSVLRQRNCDSRYSKEITQLTQVVDNMGEASAKVRKFLTVC